MGSVGERKRAVTNMVVLTPLQVAALQLFFGLPESAVLARLGERRVSRTVSIAAYVHDGAMPANLWLVATRPARHFGHRQ